MSDIRACAEAAQRLARSVAVAFLIGKWLVTACRIDLVPVMSSEVQPCAQMPSRCPSYRCHRLILLQVSWEIALACEEW